MTKLLQSAIEVMALLEIKESSSVGYKSLVLWRLCITGVVMAMVRTWNQETLSVIKCNENCIGCAWKQWHWYNNIGLSLMQFASCRVPSKKKPTCLVSFIPCYILISQVFTCECPCMHLWTSYTAFYKFNNYKICVGSFFQLLLLTTKVCSYF